MEDNEQDDNPQQNDPNTSRTGSYTRPPHVPSGDPKEFPKYDNVAKLLPVKRMKTWGLAQIFPNANVALS